MSGANTVSIRLSAAELWTLINNFSSSYESGCPENKLEDRVAGKLSEAYEKIRSE